MTVPEPDAEPRAPASALDSMAGSFVTDVSAARLSTSLIAASGAGFACLDREGNEYLLGTTAAAQLSDGGRVFAWHLEQVQDALGNTATFTWQRDGGQLYLATCNLEGPFTRQPTVVVCIGTK